MKETRDVDTAGSFGQMSFFFLSSGYRFWAWQASRQ